MNNLHHHYKQLEKELKSECLLTLDIINHPRFEQICNSKEFLITVHRIDHKRPLFINNSAKRFFGLQQNRILANDCALLLRHYHYTSYRSISDTFQFVRDRQKGFLDLSFKLLSKNKEWKDFTGSAKSLLCDEFGTPLYTLIMAEVKRA